MNRRPLALTIYAISLLLVAFSIPIQAAYLQDYEFTFENLTWLNILVMFLCVSLSVASLYAHPSLRILLPVTIATVTLNNWWVGYVGFDYDMSQAGTASLGFALLTVVLLEKKARRVLKKPELNWWQSSKRGLHAVDVALSPWLRGPTLHKPSFDLSDSGLFVRDLRIEELSLIKLGEKFEAKFYLDGYGEINCTVKVVRKTPGHGAYPSGVGLKFEGLKMAQKNSIKKLSHRLPEPTAAFH